jgi:dTDP-4-amino-4,6-dideoxygalactose transaminase
MPHSTQIEPSAVQIDGQQVQLNDFKRQWDEVRVDVLRAVEQVGGSGHYVLGNAVSECEAGLAGLFGRAHAVGCASGLDAIEIGLRALGLKPFDRVLTTPLSAFATTLAIIRAGGSPVFVDVDAQGLVDLDVCRAFLEKNRDVRFFVPVHLFGRSLDLDKLADLKRDFSLKIVEDCAQSVLARFGGRLTGSVGQIAATSFYPTKNLGAFGDAGAVFTDDQDLQRRCVSLRNYGQSSRYVHDELGLNSRLDELHAAILVQALIPRLGRWTERRCEIAKRYLTEIKNPQVQIIPVPRESNPVWHLFPVLVAADRRTAFRDHLESDGVQSAIHYPRLISDQEALTNGSQRFEVYLQLTNARRLSLEEVSLPIHPQLSEADVDRVIASASSWAPK